MSIWEPGMSLEDVKKKAVKEAYEHHGENKMRTARALKISLRGLRLWLNKIWKDEPEKEVLSEK